ncbi:hypothetical protein [Nocardia sp. CC227C]|uniref:hypothetical protein n=1 Tax=Nocardia sp. CC227C TaxID=3044562 RepID=UPI00278C4DFD|nr:hypothetical protein [Nocardia sp. CC227C]
MAWLQMLLDFIETITWPLTVIVLCVLFRKPAARFLEELQELAFPGGHLKRHEGDRRAAELKASSTDETLTGPIELPTVPPSDSTPDPSIESALYARIEKQADLAQAALKTALRINDREPARKVAAAYSALMMAIDDRSISTDPLMPEEFLFGAIQLMDLAMNVERGKVTVSEQGASDFAQATAIWLYDYQKFVERQLEAAWRVADGNLTEETAPKPLDDLDEDENDQAGAV